MAALVLVGCPGSLEDPSRFHETQPLCAARLDPPNDIFKPKCGDAICHGGGSVSAAGLDLVSPNLPMRLIDVPAIACTGKVLVSTASVGASVLLDRISASPTCGARMPQGRDPLSDDELACVRAWAQSITSTTGSSM